MNAFIFMFDLEMVKLIPQKYFWFNKSFFVLAFFKGLGG